MNILKTTDTCAECHRTIFFFSVVSDTSIFFVKVEYSPRKYNGGCMRVTNSGAYQHVNRVDAMLILHFEQIE